jgi:Zn-dependent protease
MRLFRLAGIQVYLHWSWFVVALIEIQGRSRSYNSYVWNAWEYIALFALVLLHEFGHSLACRSVGGQADQIVLWPLGGVAYVSPPHRPGATLWSIAAGPLVNLILFPILTGLNAITWTDPNVESLVHSIWFINMLLFCFNILPIYPLDGGQIFQSLLWFILGYARSLMVASIFGVAAIVSALCLAAFKPDLVGHFIDRTWMIILALFMLMNCWNGFMHARRMSRAAAAPPIMGNTCPQCGNLLPVDAPRGMVITCPHCGTQYQA